MTQQDLSSPEHRVENLSRHMFVRAYAELHQVILSESWRDKPISDLRVVCEVVDAQLAQKFDISISTLRKMFAAVTSAELVFKTGNGEAE